MMLLQSNQSIRVLAGGGGGEFWSTLKKPLTAAAGRLQKIGGKIQMIVLDPTAECYTALQTLHNEFKGTFEYALATAKSEISHFIVCDSRIVRIEEPHPPLSKKDDAGAIKARVNFRSPTLAEEKEKLFAQLWAHITSAAV